MSKITPPTIQESGLKGIHRGEEIVAKAAETITATSPGDDRFVDAVVDLIQGEQTLRASQKVLKVAKETEEDIVDILA